MSLDSNRAGRRGLKKAGTHRTPRKKPSALTRTVAVGGAAFAIGAAYELSAPVADALSIVFNDGKGNATQVNIVEGNIFDPQLGILGANESNNVTMGGLAIDGVLEPGTPNQLGMLGNLPIIGQLNALWSRQIVLGNAAGGVSNVTQVNVFSFNIFNPQASPFGNTSNNTTISNVTMGNGNGIPATTAVTGSGGLASLLIGGGAGNGNSTQFAVFSGNIFNPQLSLFGPNASTNMAATNAAIDNGNDSVATSAGGFGGVFGTTGNGNANQFAGFTSNIVNPQFNLSGTNASDNTAATNIAGDNGNDSDNVVSGSGNNLVLGTNGNGVANQTATGTGNIFNDQFRFGFGTPNTSTPGTTPGPTNPVVKIRDAVNKALGRTETSSNPPGPSTNDADD